MAGYINSGFDLADAETAVIPVNRWSRISYSLQVESGQVLLEGTITQLNRTDRVTGIAPTPVWNTLDDDDGNPISTQGPDIVRINGYALEAVRVTATGATVGRFMQQGETD